MVVLLFEVKPPGIDPKKNLKGGGKESCLRLLMM